jgi:hypothetical protein
MIKDETWYVDEGEDVFSIINHDNIKIFIEKDETNNFTNRFVSYGLDNDKISLSLNDNHKYDIVDNYKIVDTNLRTKEITKIQLTMGGIVHDCTKTYNKVGRNKIVLNEV